MNAFPLDRQQTDVVETLNSDLPTQTRTRVLLVEDNPTDVRLMRTTLIDLNERELFGPVFEIQCADRLSAAIVCLTEKEFDVVLLDLSLPDSQGLEETFARLRKHSPGIPVIVLTGLGDEALGLKIIRAGGQDYLIKSRMNRYLLVKAIRYAIERNRAEQAKKELQLRLVTVQEEERHRISRELHDQMGQSLAALMLGLKSLVGCDELELSSRGQIEQLHDLANDLAKDVHALALDLRPTALDDLGLPEALSNYLEEWSARWNLPVDFHTTGFEHRRIALHLETTIYRIVQEALTNVVRHANARNISVILERRADNVLTIIEDDGCGFDAEAMLKSPVKERRLGLFGMQERVGLVSGDLKIESTPGSGTSLYVRIPTHPNGEGGTYSWTNYAFS